MKTFKVLHIMMLGLFIVVFLNGSALATPMADFSYVETDFGGGTWQYEYTLFNTSDPVADAGFDLYDVFFAFDPTATFTVTAIPTGWDWNGGSGFADMYSLNPGEPPIGTDIAPGASLSDFVFLFDYRAGALPFDVLLWNTNDPDNPAMYSGTSSGTTSAVPEPSTLLLLSAGITGMVLLRKRFKVWS
jgi:hypothetical protein